MFEKIQNPIYSNIIKKLKEKYKKSVHYLLNIEQSIKKEIDYSNYDLSGSEINIDDKEKNLRIYLKNMNINLNTQNYEEKLDEEINSLGEKYDESLLNEKKIFRYKIKRRSNAK